MGTIPRYSDANDVIGENAVNYRTKFRDWVKRSFHGGSRRNICQSGRSMQSNLSRLEGGGGLIRHKRRHSASFDDYKNRFWPAAADSRWVMVWWSAGAVLFYNHERPRRRVQEGRIKFILQRYINSKPRPEYYKRRERDFHSIRSQWPVRCSLFAAYLLGLK